MRSPDSRRRDILSGLLVCLLGGCASIGGQDPGGDDVDAGASVDAGGGGGPADAAQAPDAPPAAGPPCVEGDRQHQDDPGATCYFLFEAPVTWLTARMQCRALGADLARIDSAAENDLLFAMAANLVDVWVGGNDIVLEGNWVWLDDSEPIAPPMFDAWRANEPNNGGSDGEDCMILEVGKGQKEWDDRNCENREYPFICERP